MSIPPLRHAFLAHIAADWEDFAELRRAASARGHRSRLSNAVSILVNEIRVSMAAALLSAPLHGSAALDAAAASEATAKAARLYAYARTIIADGRAALVEAWHFTAEQCDTVLTGLASAVGPPPRLGPDDIPRPLPAPMSGPGRRCNRSNRRCTCSSPRSLRAWQCSVLSRPSAAPTTGLRSRIVHVSFTYRSRIVHVSFSYRSRIVLVSFSYRSRIVLVLVSFSYHRSAGSRDVPS